MTGVCINNSTRGTYTCQCPANYYGPNCQFRILACSSNPCANSATCYELNNGGYSCVCPSGYTGPRCEVQINYCQANTCNYGGTCIPLTGGFRCICPTGTTGNASEQSK